MGNQVRNGRNNKDSIIKLSLNSFSTNTAIHDFLSSYNDNKLKKLINPSKFDRKYISKMIPTEKITNYNCNKKFVLNNNNKITKDNLNMNSRNENISQKNKIIFLSSNFFHPNKSNKNNIINLSHKLDFKIKDNNTKTIHTEIEKNNYINKNKNKILINQNTNKNLNKELSHSILYKPNIDNNANKNKNKKILNLKEVDSLYCTENENENKSSKNSSKFINLDILNEKISIMDGLELTNHSNINNINNDENNKESYSEIEFEDYIKKLNLGNFNIDRELFERPLFYNRSKKINSNKSSNKIKNYFNKISYESKFLPDENELKNLYKNKNHSLRNSLKKSSDNKNKNQNLSFKSKTDKTKKESNFNTGNKKKNNDIIIYRNNHNYIPNISLNTNNKSRRVLDSNYKKESKGFSRTNSKLLISNNLYNISNNNNNINDNSFFNQKYNSKKKEYIHKDYFNFKKVIQNNFNNKTNLQISDFLMISEKNLNIKSHKNKQKSTNVSFKKIKSDKTSRNDSPQFKKMNKIGRNDILSKYMKNKFQSANLSKSNNLYITGNSYENNLINDNNICEKINKKNYKKIRIFRNKNDLENISNKKNSTNKNNSKTKIKKLCNNSINRIKYSHCLINKRSCSTNDIFENHNNCDNKKNKISMLINTKNFKSIQKREISPKLCKNYNNEQKRYLYKNINNKKNILKNKNKIYAIKHLNNNKFINKYNNIYNNLKNNKNNNNFFHKSYSKNNFICKTNIINYYKN